MWQSVDQLRQAYQPSSASSHGHHARSAGAGAHRAGGHAEPCQAGASERDFFDRMLEAIAGLEDSPLGTVIIVHGLGAA